MAQSGRMTIERAKVIVSTVQKATRDGVKRPMAVAASILHYDTGAFGRAYSRALFLIGPDWPAIPSQGVPAPSMSVPDEEAVLAEIGTGIRRPGGYHVPEQNLWAIEQMRKRGLQIVERDDGHFFLDRAQPPGYLAGAALTIYSDRHNRFRFGAMGDTHIGSQYHRSDVLNDLYRRYAEAEVSQVFHTGNYIEGESRFNKHELTAHSMQGQVAMCARDYPNVSGITTHAISGDDHEGWYAQREGINIGRFTQDAFRHAGRSDWHDLGYMEAHVRLVNSNSGKESMMSVVHPGGGSSYAVSYSIQKIIESLDGGEKPAVGLYGHYHKLMAMNIRNVWALQTGCCQDQSGFMRKKKLEAHVGGALVTLEQDPRTGAITGFLPEMWRYFVKGYTNDRWRHGEDVHHANRMAA
jgi:predicted phosphodiesterase